jgi:hypothetical protein
VGHGPLDGCDLAELEVHYAASPDEYLSICGSTTAQSSGCLAGSTIVLEPAWRLGPDSAPVVHETLHYLSACALGSSDRFHEHPLLWGPSGVDADARAYLRDLHR